MTMSSSQLCDQKRKERFEAGLVLVQQGKYWKAHEAWEDLWLSLPENSAARRATKALIQLAAICYKPDQAASGRRHSSMQRGMKRLLSTSRRHLADSCDLAPPAPEWSRSDLEEALDALDDILDAWRAGLAIEHVRTTIAELTARFDPNFPSIAD